MLIWKSSIFLFIKEKSAKFRRSQKNISTNDLESQAWKCNLCGKYLGSGDNATKHEQETGHYNMEFAVEGKLVSDQTCITDKTIIHELQLRGYGEIENEKLFLKTCLLYTSPSPRDLSTSRMPSSA